MEPIPRWSIYSQIPRQAQILNSLSLLFDRYYHLSLLPSLLMLLLLLRVCVDYVTPVQGTCTS